MSNVWVSSVILEYNLPQSCLPFISALAIQFHSLLRTTLGFLWSDCELVHGAEPTENHFLFKTWERDRQACGLGLLYTAVKQHPEW